MTASEPGGPIRGIIPPMATPLASIDELDVGGLERLIEHILGGGAHGLFILGTTGEGPALGYGLRREVIERTCRQVGGRVPVLVGVTDSSFAEMLQLSEWAAGAGASAVVVAPPFYFQINQGDLLRMIEGFAERSNLPVYLYNQPQLTKTSYTLEMIARAAEVPGVVGIKDSSGDIGYLKDVLNWRGGRDFSVLIGPEHLLEEALLCGADGGVPGGANIFPELPVQLYEAHRRGDGTRAHEIQERMNAIGSPIWKAGEAGPGYLRRLKCALSLLGICSARPAWPLVECGAEERAQIEAHLRQQGILVR